MTKTQRTTIAALAALQFLMAGATLAQEQGNTPPPAVVVAPATMTTLDQSVSFSGRLVAEQKVELRARVSGFIEDVQFTEGQKVEQGDVLFEIESEAYEADVAQIEGQIKSAQAQEKNAQLDRERTARLVTKGTLAQADLDQADATLGDIEGQIATLQAQLAAAQLQLSYTQVVAPFPGTTGLMNFNVGALVAPDSGPLVTVTSLDPIYVEFPVSTALFLNFRSAIDAGEIEGEGTVEILLPDGTTHPAGGTINYVDAEVNRGTDTVLLRAEFPNPNDQLFDGALVQVKLGQTALEPKLTIPVQSIQRDLAGSFAMVVGSDGTVEQRRVTTGPTEQGLTEITDGLSEGEMVITEGINKVRPGIKVNAATADEATTPPAASGEAPATESDG